MQASDYEQAEIHSLNNVNADSTKLLTEKLALSRELANLKPELEHVRSQATSQQSALSEKLALQRQLSSLQVELETERRALERAKANDSKQSDQDAKLKIQLDEIRKELAKEKSDRQKKDKQVAKEAAEWETQRTILDSKLEAFRTKLRSSKDQLKETQEELQKAQAAVFERRVSVVDNPRKRNIARFDPDATIGTPGDFHAAKRNKRASTALPGDKSTFSITPFLNRTLNIAPESPEAEEAAAKEISDDQRTEKENAVPATATEVTEQDPPFPVISRGSTKPAGAKAGALSIATQKGNSRAKARKPSSLSILEKVAEEGNEENEGDEKVDEPQASTAILKGKAKAAPAETQNAQPKKKHKLLGSNRERTLFDDDDAEAPKDTRKNLFGGTIGGLNMRGGRALSIPKGGLRVGLGPTEFSPLKKERKSAAL
jgi:hypothetical protein